MTDIPGGKYIGRLNRIEFACAVALKHRINRAPATPVPGAKRAPFPGFITPCDDL
jgi:hypothetical protein